MLKVSEIFYSIQGEGRYTGIPMVFIRLQGCNLVCSYCDTPYGQSTKEGTEMSIEEVVEEVKKYKNCEWICITGGEPLTQEEELEKLVGALFDSGYKVEIETNGSILPTPKTFGFSALRELDSWVVDFKCPCSGGSFNSFNPKWLPALTFNDQLKFVVSNKEELDLIPPYIDQTSAEILVSPIWGSSKEFLDECVEFCKEYGVRFSWQIHKLLWGPTKRGV